MHLALCILLLLISLFHGALMGAGYYFTHIPMFLFGAGMSLSTAFWTVILGILIEVK